MKTVEVDVLTVVGLLDYLDAVRASDAYADELYKRLKSQYVYQANNEVVA